MNAITTCTHTQPEHAESHAGVIHLHQAFVARVMPAVERHARIHLRHIRCPGVREDLIAEAIGIAWKWFQRLAERGKDGTAFPSALATYAVKAVRCGRRVGRQENDRDVLSRLAQQRRDFAVGKLPDFSTLASNPLAEALHDNMRSPVDEQVAFRIDFPAWLCTFDTRRRSIIVDLGMGNRTQEIAARYGVSEGRISQMRGEARTDWQRFTGEEVVA